MTNTAQVLGSIGNYLNAASQSSDGSLLGMFRYLVAGLAMLASPFVIQEATEYLIAFFKLPFYIKPFVPKALSAAVGGALAWAGLDPVTATASATALAGAVKWVNESKWGLDLEERFKLARGTAQAEPQPTAEASAGAAKVGAILLALCLAGSLHADTVASGQPESKAVQNVNGWLAGPSTFITGAEYAMQADGSLTATAETVVGGQYGFYLGGFHQSTTGTIQFDPLAYLAFGLGVSTGTGETRPVGMVSLGFRDFGISASWNVGSGNPLPLVGIQATIPFLSIIPGLDWDMQKTVTRNFPGASW